MDNEQYGPNNTNGQFPGGESSQPVNNNQPHVSTEQAPTAPNPYGDPSGGPAEGGFTSQSNGDIIIQPDTKQKKRKGLIAAIICIAVLFLGGGAFTAFAIINNQPNNIAISALNNLLNAKQVKVNGTLTASTSSSSLFGIESVNINFDEAAANSNQSTTANAKIKLAGNSDPISINLGEVMMSDGIFYVKVDGLKTLYQDTLYDQISSYLSEMLRSNYQYSIYSQCYDTATTDADYETCSSIYSAPTFAPEAEAIIEENVSTIMTEVGSIIKTIDNQWIEFSIDDILSSDMLSLDTSTRQSIAEAYNCVVDKVTHISNYSNELSSLYSQNPFLVMTAGQDSFYDISFDAANLAGYLSAIPQTQLTKDIAACSGSTADIANSEITAADIQPALDYLPQVSAKFNGNLFSHQLSELKVNESNDYYTISSDLKFTYPSDLTVSVPPNAHPVMEIVQEVYSHITALQTTIYSF